MRHRGIPVLAVLLAAGIPSTRALEFSDASAAGFLATAATATSASPQQALQCPLAKYNTAINRYEVEPVNQRIRAKLELRQSVAGKALCNGPLVTAPGDFFSFEAVHYHPKRAVWEGVLAAVPELEKAAHEQPPQLFEVCVVSTRICVAHLEPPPPSNFLERLGFWVPRERSPYLQICLRWVFAVIAIYAVVVVIGVFAVPYLLNKLGIPDDEVIGSPEEQDPDVNSHTPTTPRLDGIPTSWTVITKAVSSLGLFASTVLSLILVCCYFIYAREVVDNYARILTYGPVVLVMLHVLVLWRSTSKTLLYNAMLRKRLHIVFNERGLLNEPLFLSAIAVGGAMLFAGFMTIFADAKQMQCESGSSENSADCMSLSHTCSYVGFSLWVLLFPVAYCLYLIYKDEAFETNLVPVYDIYQMDECAMSGLGETVPIAYTRFVNAARQRRKDGDVDDVTFAWARQFAAADSETHPALKESPIEGLVEAIKTDWAGNFSLWSWRLRLRHSQHRSLEIRIMLALGLAAISWSILVAVLAEIFRLTLVPDLVEITPSLGQLSPAFDSHIFNYNLLVDHHVKSGSLEVIANKNRVSQISLNLQNDQETSTPPWSKATKNVHVPFFVRSNFDGHDDGQAEVYSDSRNAPVPIKLQVHGAGYTFVYTITVVKMETRISSLEYRYNTTGSVNEVVVRKEVDWDRLMQTEVVDEEVKEFADPETEGAAVYVPTDTQTVLVSMERNLRIYGPAGVNVLKNVEIDDFHAARKLVLCPPKAGKSTCEKKHGASRVNVQGDVTALPVELRPNGTDPLRFMVNIVRVANRLVNLDLEAPMRKVTGGTGWGQMPLLPVFRPLVETYETFFQVPDVGRDEKDQEHTLFLRVQPQGNSLTNWVEAEVLPNSDAATDLELFCRPAEDDDVDEPLDPTRAADTADLECGATDHQAHDPEEGKPTEDLIIRDKRSGRAFKKIFFIRYKYKTSEPAPFTMLLRVSFLERVVEGAVADIKHRTYEVKFLPQAPMQLDFFVPFQTSQKPALLEAGDRYSSESTSPPVLPLFLSPAFRSDILDYNVVLPRNTDVSVLVRLLQSHSLWAGGDTGPLRGLGQGAELRQEVKLKHGPACANEGPAPAPATAFSPAPAPEQKFTTPGLKDGAQPALLQTGTDICAVQIRIYERREGFPRTYTVHLHEARPDQLLLVGTLHNGSNLRGALPEPLLGFQPAATSFNSSLKDLEFNWGPPSPAPAPTAPAPAVLEAPAPATAAQVPDEPAIMPLAFSAAAAAAKAMTQDPALDAMSHTSALVQNLQQLQGGSLSWTGEPLPSGVIAVLAASKTAYLTANWNGKILLSTDRAEGLLWHTTLAGWALVEACWCDRDQLMNKCLARLKARAPSAIQRFYKPNACRLTLKIDGKAVQSIKVGQATDVVDGALLDEAADAAERVELGAQKRQVGNFGSLLQNQARGSRKVSGAKVLSNFSNFADELLLPPSLSENDLLLSPSFSGDEPLLPPSFAV